jgi:hypothetical protein
MPTELGANQVSELVRKGHERVKDYRIAAMQALREYVGDHYVKPRGMAGEYPINLIFVALRTWVPNLVMNAGINRVTTPVLEQSNYASLLSAALNELHKKIGMKSIMRAGVVDMILCGLAIFKISIFADGNLIPDGYNQDIDPGQLYTDLISIDDFFFDPYCTALNKSTLTGHFTTVRRQDLLDVEGWNTALVKSLPSAWDGGINDQQKAARVTRDPALTLEMIEAQDYVRVGEVYLPEADAVVYVPDPKQATFDDFLKVQDYYGPARGPYRFGSLTPPVPNNPFPVAPVSAWRTLNKMANSMYIKLMDQADSQKDLLLYKPGMEDVAQAVADAYNGQSIRTPDPDGVKVVSYGGGNPENEKMVQQTQFWFNYLSGGVDQMSGLKTGGGSKTATAVRTLQSNASVVQEDARGLIYDVQAGISNDQAWFFHYDPFLNMPSIVRETGKAPRQVVLTPKEVNGNFLSLTFEIVKRSMQAVEPEHRRQALEKMLVNIIPGIANAQMLFQQLGQRFDGMQLLINAADEMGIPDIMIKVVDDPAFTERLKFVEEHAGLDPGKAGKATGSVAGAIQNNGNPSAVPVMNEQQGFNQQAQIGANQAQSEMAEGF